MILSCSCTGYLGKTQACEYQDSVYGKGKRVHTPMAKEPKGEHWRCTICRTERSSSGSDKKKK